MEGGKERMRGNGREFEMEEKGEKEKKNIEKTKKKER